VREAVQPKQVGLHQPGLRPGRVGARLAVSACALCVCALCSCATGYEGHSDYYDVRRSAYEAGQATRAASQGVDSTYVSPDAGAHGGVSDADRRHSAGSDSLQRMRPGEMAEEQAQQSTERANEHSALREILTIVLGVVVSSVLFTYLAFRKA
jgi:hypothetical protein